MCELFFFFFIICFPPLGPRPAPHSSGEKGPGRRVSRLGGPGGLQQEAAKAGGWKHHKSGTE